MARLLIFSDLHNDARALEKLMEIEADYYFCDGDLVSWQRGLEKMGAILDRRAGRVYVLPGNHESERDIEAFCARHSFVNFHGANLKVGNYYVAGLGGSNPTPFDTPGEYSEEDLASRLQPFSKLKPLVLICHAPPLDTDLDRVRDGLHAGSSARARVYRKVPTRVLLLRPYSRGRRRGDPNGGHAGAECWQTRVSAGVEFMKEKPGVRANPGSCILAPGFWLLASGSWLLAPGSWLLAPGFWLLASGFWLLAPGFWLLHDAGLTVRPGGQSWFKKSRMKSPVLGWSELALPQAVE